MGLIDRATVDRIYAAADIVEIIGDYVTLKRKGVNYQACCPFHLSLIHISEPTRPY